MYNWPRRIKLRENRWTLNRVYFLCAPHDLEALKDLIVVKGT